MDEDWSIDVRKYVPDADSGVIAAIVRYCGIALRSRDASLVSFTDPAETDRVRENFLKKKLGLTDPDSVLDAAIAAVGKRMSGDSTRNRVTVYYLLAEHFGKLGLLGGGTADTALPLMAAAAPAAAATAAAAPHHRATDTGLMGWLPFLLLGLVGLGVLAIILRGGHKTADVAAPVIPTGAGIVTSEVDGKPMVSIYFDTAKYDIYPNFEARTEALRGYVSAHPDTHLQLSGFNDPRGDPAFNAKLSKNRAFAVRDALAKLGVPLAAMDLVKPTETTDTADSLAQARRVDVTVMDGPVPTAAAAAEGAAEAVAPATTTP